MKLSEPHFSEEDSGALSWRGSPMAPDVSETLSFEN